MKKILAPMLALALAFAMVGCSSSTEPEQTDSEPDSTPAVDPTPEVRSVTVTDMSGDQVTIEGEVTSLVNLWPAGTSSFFVMGAGDLVKGLAVNNAGTMNEWTKVLYPACTEIPALGGTTPAIEELINLDPDLVIVHPMTVSSGFAQQIRDVGIPAININFSTYETMIQAYTMLGEALGSPYQEKLATWVSMVQSRQAEVEKLTAGLTDDQKPVVYYIAGQSDSLTTTMGANSICADWTRIAGGIYATTLMTDPNTTEPTAEEIFAVDPDVIIVGGVWQHELVEQLQTTDGWKDLKAVKNGRVYTNPYGAFNWDRFGLESFFQIGYAFMCIQPDLAEANGFTHSALVDEIKSFYKTMNGIDFTTDMAENMIAGMNPDGSMPTAGGQGGGGNGQGGGQGNGSGGGNGQGNGSGGGNGQGQSAA